MARRDGRIDSVFADMNVPQRPGAALLVIDHDEIVCSKCYGLADLATQRPITTDTSFYLASISKQFTAMAIMMLAERGKLSFDDHLPTYFPRFPAWAAGITLRHAASHIGTAGLSPLHEGRRIRRPRHEWDHERGRAPTSNELAGIGVSCWLAVRLPWHELCAAGDDRRNRLRSILRRLPESQRFQSARHEE